MKPSRFRFPHSFTKALAALNVLHKDLRILVIQGKLPADNDTRELLAAVEFTILFTNKILDLYGEVDCDE